MPRKNKINLKFTSFYSILICGLGASTTAYAIEDAAVIELGKAEYMTSCAACHGDNAMGSGPVAEVLTVKPPDLTQISKKYDGTFPSDFIYQIIDGRQMVNPHGDRSMPVWGFRYYSESAQRAQEVPHDVNEQALVYGRISALVKYLESIQAN